VGPVPTATAHSTEPRRRLYWSAGLAAALSVLVAAVFLVGGGKTEPEADHLPSTVASEPSAESSGATSTTTPSKTTATQLVPPTVTTDTVEAAGQWRPDLNGDGAADLIELSGATARFFFRTDGVLTPLMDKAGLPVVLDLSEAQTFVCDGSTVIAQRFDVSGQVGMLRPLTLVVLEDVGRWHATPGFLMGADFMLPRWGTRCPAQL